MSVWFLTEYDQKGARIPAASGAEWGVPFSGTQSKNTPAVPLRVRLSSNPKIIHCLPTVRGCVRIGWRSHDWNLEPQKTQIIWPIYSPWANRVGSGKISCGRTKVLNIDTLQQFLSKLRKEAKIIETWKVSSSFILHPPEDIRPVRSFQVSFR